ncbi:hypothetical protein niasHT_015422 [Heterodera trifolii]|uniref:Uncharacterized protein n=1 Tax=Heterodera trifolii TaxID=157864 RepID=A0ABD2KZV4_9BILA
MCLALRCQMLLFLWLSSLFLCSMAFNIPFILGNVGFTKKPNGDTQLGLNSGLNIGGHGAESGLTFNFGKGGSFNAQSDGGVLVGGDKFGTNSTFGVDKKGLVADTDVHLGDNKTLHGGLGKEKNFIEDLADLIRRRKEEKQRQKEQRIAERI